MKYRITFSPNGLEPFTYLAHEFYQALRLANLVAYFDLGQVTRADLNTFAEARIISAYKAYRRNHDINHPDLISYSTGTVDEQDDQGLWWVVSESLDEREYEVGEIPAFDNLDTCDEYEDKEYREKLDDLFSDLIDNEC